MPRSVKAPLWVQGLRTQLRSTVGPAFRVGEQRGRAKLDVRYSDGSRGTAVLPLEWLPAQAGAIEKLVVTWTPETEPALMRASLPARIGQEKPHESQTP